MPITKRRKRRAVALKAKPKAKRRISAATKRGAIKTKRLKRRRTARGH